MCSCFEKKTHQEIAVKALCDGDTVETVKQLVAAWIIQETYESNFLFFVAWLGSYDFS